MITQKQIFTADSFVGEGCAGNPAGICLLPHEYPEDFYKATAMSIGAPETAFVYQDKDRLALKWFTCNGSEVAACGHATLAAAYILWKNRLFERAQVIEFITQSGLITAKCEGEYITLDFPADTITEEKPPACDFGELLGIDTGFVGRTKYDYFVVAQQEKDVVNLRPDFDHLMQIETRGIIVTSRSNSPGYDYVNRFFAPRLGINEDPVTGSAHVSLGIYWGRVLNKSSLVGYQASKERGIVKVTVLKDRVLISGKVRENG
jgi:PhzF family phenazine biosynthesis protein